MRYPKGYIPKNAGVYVRISEILPGTVDETAGVDRQTKDCLKVADLKRWGTSSHIYCDNDVSAYKKDVVRDEWEKLLTDLKSGVIDGIIAYDLDRVARQNRDLENLIDIVEETGIPNAVVTGEIDLSTDNGKMVARILVSIANKSSADTARRVSRQKLERAEAGEPPISKNRTYGYVYDFSATVPEEKKLLQEARKRMIAGESAYALCKEFNAAGRLPYSGKPWKSQNLIKMVTNPTHAGLRAFKGEVVGVGKWEKIFTVEEHAEILTAVENNEPYSRNTARKHLLTSILVCDLCGKGLGGKAPSYYCNVSRGGCGKIVRNMKAVDEFMISLTYKAIKMLPAVKDVPLDDDNAKEIERLERKIDEARNAWKAEMITLADFVDVRQDAENKIKALRKTSAKQAKLPVDDAQAFFNASVDQQRATIKRLFPVVGVKPTGAKGTRFHPDQLVFPD